MRGVCVRGVCVRGVCVRGVCVRGVEGLHVIYCETSKLCSAH